MNQVRWVSTKENIKDIIQIGETVDDFISYIRG